MNNAMLVFRGITMRIDSCYVLLCIAFVLCRPPFVSSAGGGGSSKTQNPKVLPAVSSLIYSQISNLTTRFDKEITKALGFCITDVEHDLNGAFDYSNNMEFLNNCVKNTKGDLTQRLCTAAEMKFYFSSFFDAVEDSHSTKAHVLKPNKNCNLSSWVAGCEPGWSCSVGGNQKVDLKNVKDTPDRTSDSQPCCAGFFCPQGLTCMISCPLGAYCPAAKLNKTTGTCDPYHYQLPPGKPNHTCGGADMWADVLSGSELFCPAGYYCPTSITKSGCTSGHYCRQGSTFQKACMKLSSCVANTENQNMHYFGVMLIVVLSIILIIIYNFSDQILTTRYERLAKSREEAARYARETVHAKERWGKAKGVIKNQASGLTKTISRKFSSKSKDVPSVPQAPVPPSKPQKKKKEQSDLTKMMHSIDDNPESNEGFNLNIGDRHIKKQAPKVKELHTKSQIFKYAYNQLEKEKAWEDQRKDLTFSGLIAIATENDGEIEIRSRPTIKVVFKDLTITLKGKNTKLMRSVTGTLSPGRVSAVMGPSGAGKTTFLSAVAGKIRGCNLSGLILINDKVDSIHSYKKIIGFVPQDDVVHGNLTVEENLRFNARCRLSEDLPKADKVLVVERVIDQLGLQGVRDSLVGTVEKRGISGGQRKRVNVGIEMVMEPSLLILDEPTSGLDSSSSNLLLKALRREASEGVNICTVIHQPSYTLYRMFDDIIFLAKGGLIAYQGPVKNVEEYFSGLGINVPDRVNPPDHFIDVLEGMAPLGDGGVMVEELPVRWMLYNGYAVPPDMIEMCDQIGNSKTPVKPLPADQQDQSVNQLHGKRDHVDLNFLKPRDLSNRRTPDVLRQYRYFLGRAGKQRLREARTLAADYLILFLAGACLGTLAKVSDATFGANGYTYTIIAVSLLCKISALRSFSVDKLQYLRERASGMSSLAYFMSKDTIDHFNTIVKPVVYLCMFYFFNNPRSTFGSNYVVLLCLIYCVTGIGYAFAIIFEFSQAQLWAVLLPVVLTLISYQDKDSTVQRLIGDYCYPKWALEAFIIANAKKYSGVWLVTRCSSLMKYGYDLREFHICLIKLVLMGVGSRVLAFFYLVTFGNK